MGKIQGITSSVKHLFAPIMKGFLNVSICYFVDMFPKLNIHLDFRIISVKMAKVFARRIW